MSLVVRLQGVSGTANFQEIPLVASLYFESDARVEESDQGILNLVGQTGQTCIKSAVGSATINFRLEKVSRRKDGFDSLRFAQNAKPGFRAKV